MRVGVMQGRLLPPVGGRIQAFPGPGWAREFELCRELGFGVIEWVYERPGAGENPLMNDAGVAAIRRACESTGVAVGSVVADYFMEELLSTPDAAAGARAGEHLRSLLRRCAEAGIPLVELPFVDSSSLKDAADRARMVERVSRALEAERGCGVRLGLETDLPPAEFRSLLDSLSALGVKANFDMGNSASLGYAPDVEIPALAPYIDNVHIKDRLRGGGTVPLGAGNVDFAAVFRNLSAIGYRGDFIFQSARRDLAPGAGALGPVETVRGYAAFVEPHLRAFR